MRSKMREVRTVNELLDFRRKPERSSACHCVLSINIGLAAMVLLSTLPIGLAQAWASVEVGTWYARSSEFLHTPMLTRLRWMRMFGDTIFAFGAVVLGWFVLGLVTGHSFDQNSRVLKEGEYAPQEQEQELVHEGD